MRPLCGFGFLRFEVSLAARKAFTTVFNDVRQTARSTNRRPNRVTRRKVLAYTPRHHSTLVTQRSSEVLSLLEHFFKSFLSVARLRCARETNPSVVPS